MGIGEVLGAVNAELGGRWQVGRRLAGGWNDGAYLLIGGGGARAVLTWRASDPERLLGARERVAAARARGWPAPEWLVTGQALAGEAWVVQEFIAGRAPPRLDDCAAEQMTGILGLQEAMFPGAAGGWGQWAAGVVFEGWDGLRGLVSLPALLSWRMPWWARWHARRGPLEGAVAQQVGSFVGSGGV